MIEVISLRYGTAFKKAFRDPEVFTAFVRDATGVSIDITEVQQEYSYKETIGRVKIEYDLFAEDTKHRTIVELQHIRDDDTFERFLYYHIIALIDQVHGHQRYAFDRDVITLVVLTRDIRDKRWQFDWAEVNFDVHNVQGTALGIFNHRLVFVNARRVSATTPAALRPWLEMVEDSLDGKVDEGRFTNDLLQRVIQRIRVDRVDPEEAMRLKDEATWEVAKADARADGERKGRADGLADGLAEGEKKGRIMAMKDAARRLVDAGHSPEDAARLLGITVEDLQEP